MLRQALVPAMPLEGKRVLIHAGAGGVGGFAIQVSNKSTQLRIQNQWSRSSGTTGCDQDN